jgi:hypothetical protein
MGLLDDAIREHLELKRRRGADAEEVSRQEAEALGAPQQRAEFADAAPAAPAPDEEAEPPEESSEPPAGWLDDEPEPEPEPEPREPEDEVALDQPTVEYTPELEPDPDPEPEPGEPAPEGDDVLEETPDFLQETPEHDRLWFEQKPPRDFDLDR